MLVNYDWPGNVREVKNIIERICLLVENESVSLNDVSKLVSKKTDDGH